jgi:hypothetical protein
MQLLVFFYLTSLHLSINLGKQSFDIIKNGEEVLFFQAYERMKKYYLLTYI